MSVLALTPETQVCTVAAEYPATLRMFESLGIDYCCGGKRTLAEAAIETGIPVATVIAVLKTSIAQAQAEIATENWQDVPIERLLAHIVATHHPYLERELPRLDAMMATVRRVHGPGHADVLEPLGEAFTTLKAELEAHLRKEEDVVFPAITALARGEVNPVALSGARELETEHEAAGALLAEMHRVTHDFALPADACNTFRGLYAGIRELEQDIHQHIHLENNVLIPRVRALVTGA